MKLLIKGNDMLVGGNDFICQFAYDISFPSTNILFTPINKSFPQTNISFPSTNNCIIPTNNKLLYCILLVEGIDKFICVLRVGKFISQKPHLTSGGRLIFGLTKFWFLGHEFLQF